MLNFEACAPDCVTSTANRQSPKHRESQFDSFSMRELYNSFFLKIKYFIWCWIWGKCGEPWEKPGYTRGQFSSGYTVQLNHKSVINSYCYYIDLTVRSGGKGLWGPSSIEQEDSGGCKVHLINFSVRSVIEDWRGADIDHWNVRHWLLGTGCNLK